jgi:hypothetical protein
MSPPLGETPRSRCVAVNLGGDQAATILIDTGCTDMTVTQSIADTMLQRGDAETLSPANVTYADGSIHSVQQILIHRIEIGGHTLSKDRRAGDNRRIDRVVGIADAARNRVGVEKRCPVVTRIRWINDAPSRSAAT